MLPNLREGIVSALQLPAHQGFECTLPHVAQRFCWPRVRGVVSTYVRNCAFCDLNKTANPNPRAANGRLPADQPFKSLYIDIFSNQGLISLGVDPNSILTIIDELIGWAEAIPIDDQRAETVDSVVFSEWISRYGAPKQIHSDRGAQFESALFEKLCSSFGVDRTKPMHYCFYLTASVSVLIKR